MELVGGGSVINGLFTNRHYTEQAVVCSLQCAINPTVTITFAQAKL